MWKVAIFVVLVGNLANGCNKLPPNSLKYGLKQNGDNGYRLLVGNTEDSGYEPGKIYNLFLSGSQNFDHLQFFTHFMITAEPYGSVNSKKMGPKRVGRFQLFSDKLTKFYENCVNTVSEADDFPKTEVQIMWVAPEKGSGCIKLSAMVMESEHGWYSDDGGLTKIICEQKVDNLAKKLAEHECCACDEAKYNFVFEGIWSNQTHPKDFPFAEWLTHFSDIVGATHDTNFSFWGDNHIASDGFRSLAEWGSPRQLEVELRAKGGRLRTLIKAAGLWYPDVTSNASSHFRVDRKHPKMSLVSMFGPSPDWVVGVSGLNLCNKDCTWQESVDVDLYAWDSGTDSGISYMSPNAETQPRERMHRITTKYPEDPRAPFYNSRSDVMTPLAKLYIRREKVIKRNCDEEILQSQVLDEAENNDEQDIPECAVTEYSAWTPCSVSCGKGLRMRTRKFRQPQRAAEMNCRRQLVSKEMCVATVPECESEAEDSSENLAESSPTINERTGEGVGVCRTTWWSNWSECSVTCGIGISMRTRTFIEHSGRKKCPHISIVEKQKCMQPECSVADIEVPDSECPVTPWSDWSPCSATCGRGVQIRTRLLLLAETFKVTMCKKKIELNQQRPCVLQNNCVYSFEAAKEVCLQEPEVGPCRGSYKRFFYDAQKQTCEEFEYGGCRGNQNNFLAQEDCSKSCSLVRAPQGSSATTTQRTTQRNKVPTRQEIESSLPVDCVLSEGNSWSECSVTCGKGFQERYRTVVTESANGGVPCPQKVVKRRRCNMPTCA